MLMIIVRGSWVWWEIRDLLREVIVRQGESEVGFWLQILQIFFLFQFRELFFYSWQSLGEGLVVCRFCCFIYLFEQVEDEGVEAYGMIGEFWELVDFVVEVMQDFGGWVWEEDRVGSYTFNFWNFKFSLGFLFCYLVFIQLCGSFNYILRYVFSLFNDDIQYKGFEFIFQYSSDGRV